MTRALKRIAKKLLHMHRGGSAVLFVLLLAGSTLASVLGPVGSDIPGSAEYAMADHTRGGLVICKYEPNLLGDPESLELRGEYDCVPEGCVQGDDEGRGIPENDGITEACADHEHDSIIGQNFGADHPNDNDSVLCHFPDEGPKHTYRLATFRTCATTIQRNPDFRYVDEVILNATFCIVAPSDPEGLGLRGNSMFSDGLIYYLTPDADPDCNDKVQASLFLDLPVEDIVNIFGPATVGTGAGGGGGGGGGGGEEEQPSCEDTGEWGWLQCPILRVLDEIVSWLDERIRSELTVDPAWFDEGSGVRDSWASMRNIAYFILVPITLVMVIGTALGFDAISAYTVRRALPRLVIAVVFIAVSFDLIAFITVLSNDVGQGLVGLVSSAAVGDGDITIAGLFDPAGPEFLVLLGGSLAAFAIVFPILIGFAGVIAINLFVGFLMLQLREVLIVALTIVAPLAVLSWIFPGNDKLSKIWWYALWTMLAVFPLVSLLIGVGYVLASTLQAGPPPLNPVDGFIRTVLAGLILTLGYVAAPFLLTRLGAFGQLLGGGMGAIRGLKDRVKGAGREATGKRWQRAKNNSLFQNAPNRGLRIRSRINSMYAGAAALPKAGLKLGGLTQNLGEGGWNPRNVARNLANNVRQLPAELRGRVRSVRGRATRQDEKAVEENPDFADDVSGDDDLSRALATSILSGRNLSDVLQDEEFARGRYTTFIGQEGVDDPDDMANHAWNANWRESLAQDTGRGEQLRFGGQHSDRALAIAGMHAAIRGGTTFGGGAHWIQMATQIAGDDDTMLGHLIGRGIEEAKATGRPDMVGNFAHTMGLAMQMRDHGVDLPEANRRLARHTFMDLSAPDLANPKVRAAAIGHLTGMDAQGNQVGPNHALDILNDPALSERDLGLALAGVANLHEGARSSKNSAANAMANGILQSVPVNAPAGMAAGMSIERIINAIESGDKTVPQALLDAFRQKRKPLPSYAGAPGGA